MLFFTVTMMAQMLPGVKTSTITQANCNPFSPSPHSGIVTRKMSTLTNSFVSVQNHRNHFVSDQCVSSTNMHIGHSRTAKLTKQRKSLTVKAGANDDRLGGASLFVGGFVLGGIVVGTLGAIYAPQISKALAGADRKDLMRKLPKFIYDEEKALEKTRKILTEKIAQLNSAIDDVSAQLRADDPPNGSSVPADEVEASY